MKLLLAKLLKARLAKLAAGGVGALLAAIGGVTTIGALQPAVEKSSDYAARAVEMYCELPLVDRDRFRAEVNERLGATALITVRCALDPLTP